MAKRFGGTRVPPVPEEIELEVERDGQVEIERFVILPRVSAGDALGAMSAFKSGDTAALTRLDGMLTRVMSDSDGQVKASWKMEALTEAYRGANGPTPVPSQRELERLPEHERDFIERNKMPPHYRGPDGVLYPVSDEDTAAKWKDPRNGTSRRRWRWLLDEDDTAHIELSDLMALTQYVMERAADRPTQPQG